MIFPDYNWKSIFNLMISISNFLWVKSEKKELDFIVWKELEKFDNVILFVVDALGYNWLQKYWKGSFLEKNCSDKMTSVFPSTTSSAITTFYTVKEPIEHSVIWRDLWINEFQMVWELLPWKARVWWWDLPRGYDLSKILPEKWLLSKTDIETFVVTNEKYLNSPYNNFYTVWSKIYTYSNLKECFNETLEAIETNKKKKFIYSYRPGFDESCHDFWVDWENTINHFEDIDYWFEKLVNKLKWTNTFLIVTADHGQVNLWEKIFLQSDYPELIDMLQIPMTWDPRCRYCYIKSWQTENFEKYVKENMKDVCEIYSKEETIQKNIFWISKPNKLFLDRFWDFMLIAKENYALYDTTDPVKIEKIRRQVANHAWASEDEMYVPMIKIEF